MPGAAPTGRAGGGGSSAGGARGGGARGSAAAGSGAGPTGAGGTGGSSGGTVLGAPTWPGTAAVMFPTAVRPGPKTTVTVEPCSALPAVTPVQLTVVPPATTGAQAKPSWPTVVEKTANGRVPAATPAGTVAVSVQRMLAATTPLPLVWPQAVQARTAHGGPPWPLAGVWAIACWRVRLPLGGAVAPVMVAWTVAQLV